MGKAGKEYMEVVLSGGDPLMLAPSLIENLADSFKRFRKRNVNCDDRT